MTITLHGYEHAVNGMSLQLVPETEIERRLLEILWKHGRLEIGYPHTFLIHFRPGENEEKL